MKYCLFSLFSIFLFAACNADNKNAHGEDVHGRVKKYARFSGDYAKAFNDMQELHIDAARRNGVGPLTLRDDTLKYINKLVRIPDELFIYKTDRLKHSVPFLTRDASVLLTDICLNFRDSLISKDMPLYRLIITSITRTDNDVKNLSRRNVNASSDSAHRYGTTFDISWVRYDKLDAVDERTRTDGQLKLVLGQVLYDLKQRGRCYVKHERKQSCFHITVR